MGDLYENYSVLINLTNFTHTKKHVGATEGGVLSGHGPLDTPLALFLVQVIRLSDTEEFSCFIRIVRFRLLLSSVCLGSYTFSCINCANLVSSPKSLAAFVWDHPFWETYRDLQNRFFHKSHWVF